MRTNEDSPRVKEAWATYLSVSSEDAVKSKAAIAEYCKVHGYDPEEDGPRKQWATKHAMGEVWAAMLEDLRIEMAEKAEIKAIREKFSPAAQGQRLHLQWLRDQHRRRKLARVVATYRSN